MANSIFLFIFGIFTIFFRTNHFTKGQIPVSMWRKVANVTSATEFIEKFLSPQQPDTVNWRPKLYKNEENGITPTNAETSTMDASHIASLVNQVQDEPGCTPHPAVLSIPVDEDPSIIRWPTCTTVARCGGCCGHEILQCSPTHVQMQHIQVFRARYPFPGADRFVVEGIEEVLMERHLSCECRCRIQPQHCDPTIHQYDPDSCSCLCLNEDTSCSTLQVWDDHTCSCRCKNREICTEDEVFDNNTCTCVEQTASLPFNDIPHPTQPTREETSHTSSACRNVRCLVGFEAQMFSDGCRCMLGDHYASSRLAVEQDSRLRKELAGSPQPPLSRSERVFRLNPPPYFQPVQPFQPAHPFSQVQSEESFLQQRQASKVQNHQPNSHQDMLGGDSRNSESQSLQTGNRNVESNPQQGPIQNAAQHSQPHHVEISATKHFKHYPNTHRAAGGPIQLRQPMVQANYGHV